MIRQTNTRTSGGWFNVNRHQCIQPQANLPPLATVILVMEGRPMDEAVSLGLMGLGKISGTRWHF